MIDHDAYSAVVQITNEIRFDVCSYMADRGIFTKVTKENAQELIKHGYKNIWLQCQANGNTMLSREVAAEVKLHYDIERTKKDDEDDTNKN